jgi:hypothetical protein
MACTLGKEMALLCDCVRGTGIAWGIARRWRGHMKGKIGARGRGTYGEQAARHRSASGRQVDRTRAEPGSAEAEEAGERCTIRDAAGVVLRALLEARWQMEVRSACGD